MVVGPVHCSLQKFILLLNYEMKKVILFLFFFFGKISCWINFNCLIPETTIFIIQFI